MSACQKHKISADSLSSRPAWPPQLDMLQNVQAGLDPDRNPDSSVWIRKRIYLDAALHLAQSFFSSSTHVDVCSSVAAVRFRLPNQAVENVLCGLVQVQRGGEPKLDCLWTS